MTLQEMLVELPKLSTDERLRLLEAIRRSLREEMVPTAAAEATVERLFGSFKADGPAPTDEEVDQMRDEHLTQKYS